MESELIEDAARRVFEARLDGSPLTRLAGIDPNDIAAGYQVMQSANVSLQAVLGPIAGFKIGATAAHMREHLGVQAPVFGEIFASTVQLLSGQVSLSRYRRLGVETEIAVVLGRDLTAADGPWTKDRLHDAIESAHACIELVDDRYDDFRTIGAATLVADNFFGAGCALGRWRQAEGVMELDRLRARTILDGQEVASGTSDLLMGHPLEALAWLANCRAAMGLATPAGAMVTLGSITPSFWVDRPMTVRIEIESLGAVDLHVGAD